MAKKAKPQTARKKTQKVHPWSGAERRLAQLRTKFRDLPTFVFVLVTAAVGLVLAAVELMLHVSIPGSSIRNLHLPIGARIFLLSYSLLVLSFFVAVSMGLISLFWRPWSRIISLGRIARWITGGVAAFLTWFILLLYGASWGLFWQTGSFIDSQAFLFLAPHPLQVFHWVDADLAVMLVALALGGTGLIMIWLPRWIKHWPVMFQRRMVLAWSWMIGLCVLGSFLGELYSSTDGRQFMRTAILYSKIRDNASGPFPHVLADIQKQIRYRPEERIKAGDIRIIQRPIVSMEKYLANARPTHRWNVIILIVESLRADQLRVYGGSRDVMPTVDGLSRDSRVFLNAYTQSSHTDYATVTPFSSHYPLRSRTSYTYPEKPSYPRVLIYDVLKALEYHTAIFSSSNEFWGGMINFLQTGNVDRFFHAANFKGPSYVMQGDAGFADWTRETKHAGSVDDRYTVSEAIQWIEGVKREPFFLGLNFQSSHIPYMVPRDFPRRFGPAKLDFTIRFAHFPQEKIEVVKDIYADSLAYVDAQIARLFEYLKTKGLWDNTIIVLTGDHGQAFYEHGFASHASAIFDEVMKVPLVIRAPQLKPGTEDRLAQHVDIAPSIAGLLGLPAHPSFQGIDLLNTDPDPKRSAYMVAQTPLAYQYGIVRSGHKLIYDEREPRYSLYDLVADPGEKTDLAPAQPALVQDLAKRLQTWRTLQIEYYADESLQSREYPPMLAD
jgi:arylsulfatase A-like enzyme